ncbi:MAG: hypothetical protein GWP08_07080 [Nitrospiraceae bacterium]|nr:hypothetical protein [Nitrospiraceae bacterium]
MRAYLIAAWVAIGLCVFLTASAQPAQVDPEDLENLFQSLWAPSASEAPRLLTTQEGFVRFIGAPPGAYFETTAATAKSAATPEAAARGFITEHAGAFGVESTRAGYNTMRVTARDGRSYVRLQQTYGGFDVFAAQTVIQLNATYGVSSVLTDILRDTASLDNGQVSLSPTVTLADAVQAALEWVANRDEVAISALDSTDAVRMIFDPSVVGKDGALTLVWHTKVFGNDGHQVAEAMFVDAHSGEIVFNYPLIHTAKNREIYDADSEWPAIDADLVRREGDPLSGIQDVDLAYDYLGDTYDFYFNVHGRDSIDDNGMTVRATVRYCAPYHPCPYANAFWMPPMEEWLEELYGLRGGQMYFGEGFVVDDVTAHELTHGVTDFESDLIYAYQSGAMNEAFSDIWGEFVDLTNGKGTDTEEVRWLMGEDVPGVGAIRNMKDPPQFGDPDRVGSPLYWTSPFDSGGVHTNSGIINKLCYLLTDGDEFNGETVEGMGIERTARLFYECQTNLLTAASDFADLYAQLGQATVNLGYTFGERLNVQAATRAVEIAPDRDAGQLTSFRAIPTDDEFGRAVIALHWDLPAAESVRQVILVRDTVDFPVTPSEGAELYRGRAEQFLDTAVIPGATYYYALFVDLTEGFPSALFARVEAGGEPPDYLSEAFSATPGSTATYNPFDLAYSQIMFSPTGPPEAPLGATAGYGDYSQYTATIRRNISQLPVPRSDDEGDAWSLPMLDDGSISRNFYPAFPFFGKRYSRLFLASNGYIGFEEIASSTFENFPSLASHFALPRISFLFADLNPAAGGAVWAREMSDRFVVTFENVPEWSRVVDPPSAVPNTVQLELFYSGHIRITYLNVNANNAICGLSDGMGTPRDPATIFSGVESVDISSDLSELPATPQALTILPVPVLEVDAGDLVEFAVETDGPSGLGMPTFTAEWDGPGFVPFVDRGDGTGAFRWQTDMSDLSHFGMFTVRVEAEAGGQQAYQDIAFFVGVSPDALPSATNLRLRSNNPIEDPTRNRTVSVDSSLTAEYDYFHPHQWDDPAAYGEDGTQILWFKNNQIIPAFNNVRLLPSIATRARDTWFFTVKPVSATGVEGMTRQSPIVTVVNSPEVLNVLLPADVPAVVYPDDLPLIGLPAASGPSIGGTTVMILGRRLSRPMTVLFGGIPVQSIRSIGDSQIEVVTPTHIPSPIISGAVIAEDVIVTTSDGTGVLREAFRYVDSGASISKADINGDGKVDAIDVQLVIRAVLQTAKSGLDADVNRDGRVNAADIQVVINEALRG